MKLYRNLIIIILILAVLIGVYYFTNKRKQEYSISNNVPFNLIEVLHYTSDDITQVTVENKEETIVIDKKNERWTLSLPTGFKADTSRLDSIVNITSSIYAEKIIEENALNLSLYGLDKPSQIIIKLNDGSEKVLLIGDKTPTKDGYYIKLKDSGKVYVISTSTGKSLLIGKNDLKDRSLYSIKPEDFLSISMDRKGENIFKAQKGTNQSWNLLAPIQREADQVLLGDMFQALAKVKVCNYIEERPSDLSRYGLAKPLYTFEFSTSSVKHKLCLGYEKVKGSEIYAMLDGCKDVFTVNPSMFTFFDISLKDILNAFVCIVDIDKVDKMEFNMDGQVSTFSLYVYKDNMGRMDNNKDKFKMDGKDASMKDSTGSQLFRNFYQSVVGIGFDEIELINMPEGLPEITVKYYMKLTSAITKIDYVSKNKDYYYVFKNGYYTGLLVRKDKEGVFSIKGIKEAYKALAGAVNGRK